MSAWKDLLHGRSRNSTLFTLHSFTFKQQKHHAADPYGVIPTKAAGRVEESLTKAAGLIIIHYAFYSGNKMRPSRVFLV